MFPPEGRIFLKLAENSPRELSLTAGIQVPTSDTNAEVVVILTPVFNRNPYITLIFHKIHTNCDCMYIYEKRR